MNEWTQRFASLRKNEKFISKEEKQRLNWYEFRFSINSGLRFRCLDLASFYLTRTEVAIAIKVVSVEYSILIIIVGLCLVWAPFASSE